VVNHGFAVLNDEGRLRAGLRGLILQNLGTPGPVTAVAASVVCGGAVAATTDSVPLSVDGNAEIHAKLQVPFPCLGLIVLVRAAAFNGIPIPITTTRVGALLSICLTTCASTVANRNKRKPLTSRILILFGLLCAVFRSWHRPFAAMFAGAQRA
jgi:hypothetical protein